MSDSNSARAATPACPRRTLRGAAFSLVAAAAFASGLLAQNATNRVPAGDAANGRKIFETYGCYQCHGREAQGGLRTGPRLGPNPISFDALRRYVRQPTGQMPPYTAKVVSDRELADIYAFLQSLPEPPPVSEIPLLRDN